MDASETYAGMPISWEMLDRYFAGESPLDEASSVRAYLARDQRAEQLLRHSARLPEARRTAPSVAHGWAVLTEELGLAPERAGESGVREVQRDAARHAVHRVTRGVGSLSHGAPIQPSRGWIGRWAAVAGITAVVAGVVVAHHVRDGHGARNAPGLRYVTGAAQVSTVTLSDSTQIILAPNTTLTLARDFGMRTRDVMLRGEAYFEVTSLSSEPFRVRTERGALVRVLGTAFDVAAYPERRDVQVAVRTGRIQVTAAHGANSTIVGAGAVARLTDSVVTTSVTDVSPYVSWTAGSLVFNETPVRDVLAALSRWYGIRFQLADSTLERTPLTARFSTRSSADVMILLKTALRVTLTFDQAKDTTIVTLHPRTTRTNGGNESAPAREPRGIFSTHREIGR
jgi:ferric-dicitrate binding protein FerR (iron transport regulator)